MHRTARAGRPPAATVLFVSALLWLAALAAPATAGLDRDPDPAWRHAPDMPALVALLEDWLDAESALPRRAAPPALRLVSPTEARAMAGRPARGLGRARGLYDPGTGTIALVRPWSPREAGDVSVLLHELVHHRQAALHHYCPAAEEPLAYRLQEAWLAERGLPLDWPRLAIALAAGCTPHDIHPD